MQDTMLHMCGTIFKCIGGVQHIEKILAIQGLQICQYTRQNWKHYVDFKNSNYTNPYCENLDMSFFYNIKKNTRKKGIFITSMKIISAKD